MTALASTASPPQNKVRDLKQAGETCPESVDRPLSATTTV